MGRILGAVGSISVSAKAGRHRASATFLLSQAFLVPVGSMYTGSVYCTTVCPYSGVATGSVSLSDADLRVSRFHCGLLLLPVCGLGN